MSKVQVDADFIASPQFQHQLSCVIGRFKGMLNDARRDHGVKRNPAVALADEGDMNVDFVCKEYIAICKYQSTLSSGKRQVIESLVGEAALATLQEVAKQKQENNGNENNGNENNGNENNGNENPSPQSETQVV